MKIKRQQSLDGLLIRHIGEMLLLAKKYAFEFLEAKEVSLGVFVNNPKALYCYQAAGFEEYGERTNYVINGEEWECIEMKCQGK